MDKIAYYLSFPFVRYALIVGVLIVGFLDENSFVPFYRFYDTVHTFLDGAIRRVIDRADTAATKGDGLKPQDVDVLKLLFLIRYVDGIPTNIENLATLMITDINADKILIKRSLQESLETAFRGTIIMAQT